MIKIIILVTILLDGIITNYLPYTYNNLSYYTPLLTLTILSIIYPYIKKKNFFIYVIIIGLLYDLLYSNILLLNTFLFIIINYFIKLYYGYLSNNYVSNFFLIIFNVIIYETCLFITTYILGNHTIIFDDLIYKISHSLILNIIYGSAIYYFLKKLLDKKIIKIYVK